MNSTNAQPYRTNRTTWTRPARLQDLRRTHRRDAIEQIVARAAFLPPHERLLVELYFDHGRSIKDIAAASRVHDRVMSRRIRRLLERLNSERFSFVVRNMNAWPPQRRSVASAMVLQGRSIRQAARELSVSVYTVRRQHETISALFDADQRARSAPTRSE